MHRIERARPYARPGYRGIGGWARLAALSGALACAPGVLRSGERAPLHAERAAPAGAPGESSGASSAAAEAAALGYALPPEQPGRGASPAEPFVAVARESRLVRLSHRQYRRTLQDLFGLDEPPELTLAPDALDGFGFDTSNALRVDPRLGPQYRGVAEALAARVVSDPELFARVAPCGAGPAECREPFLRSFGESVFRRPLTADDLEAFRETFEAASRLATEGDAHREGVRATIEAMLQAPEFLYRMESGGAPGADGRAPLDDFEIASRLSYLLYDSMPEAWLLEAARSRRLRTPDQVEAAARYMLTQPRVLDKLVAFHEQAWHLERFARISPDAAAHPEAPAALVQRVRQATRLFLRDVLARGGGLEELLTAPYAYADAGLARLYGVELPESAPAAHFARVDFPAGERRGLLMQVGYLAANAYSISTDPIHRGLFVIRDLLCREIPDPPPGATSTPAPEASQPIVTTRDEVSLVTGQSFCPTCHMEINAPGFAFEGFDAVGQRRTTEKGAPVDTSGSMVLDGQLVSFADASELVELIARSREAHRCYSRRWLELAHGRPLAESDVPTLDAIAERSLPIADILVAIVRSREFLSLAPAAGAAP